MIINIQSKSIVRKLSPSLKRQQGVVLFFALIALLALSLAAAALVRSVDSSVLAAGNLAFKQSAAMSGDIAITSAGKWIASHALSLNANDQTAGYHASNPQPADANYAVDHIDLKSNAVWTDNTKTEPASGSGIDANGYDALTGNTTRYVIQRMCKNQGSTSASSCIFGVAAAEGGSRGALGYNGAGLTPTGDSPLYRVTARILGPKNTVSYIQSFVY